MKFVLEVDLDLVEPEQREPELSRILRYWAGNLKHYDLRPGDGAELTDSGHRPVGEWRLAD